MNELKTKAKPHLSRAAIWNMSVGFLGIQMGFGLQNGTHGSTCSDSDTPKDRHRNPKFKEVWKHMCFP